MAEVGWSAKEPATGMISSERLDVDEKRLDELGVNYRPGMSEPNIERNTRALVIPTKSQD